jgi:predicted transcriptional regulator
MRKRDAQFLIWFDRKVLDKLKQVAEEEGRTATELIREAVAALLRRREKGNPNIERK